MRTKSGSPIINWFPSPYGDKLQSVDVIALLPPGEVSVPLRG